MNVRCVSGQELVELGYTEDVMIAIDAGASQSVPVLTNGAFTTA